MSNQLVKVCSIGTDLNQVPIIMIHAILYYLQSNIDSGRSTSRFVHGSFPAELSQLDPSQLASSGSPSAGESHHRGSSTGFVVLLSIN